MVAAGRGGGPRWYMWSLTMVAVVSASGVNTYVSRQNLDAARAELADSQRRSEQVWCEVVSVLDDAYHAPGTAPQTETGRKVAAGIARVRAAYHC